MALLVILMQAGLRIEAFNCHLKCIILFFDYKILCYLFVPS